MRTKVLLACSAAAFIAIAGGTAEATGLIHTENIAKGAITFDRLAPKVQKMVTAMPKAGTNGTNGIDGIPGAPGSKGATGATGETGPMGPAGQDGAPGAAAAKGEKGDPGLPGADGAKGDTGDTGPRGYKGDPGVDGKDGKNGLPGVDGKDGKDGKDGVDAPARQYGVAQVFVARHSGTVFNPGMWATYSTLLGSPVGDTTGGTFRFTCNSNQAPCEISVKASVTGTTSHAVYPRLVITRDGDGVGGGSPDVAMCEYLDDPATMVLAATTLPLGAGGSFDCGQAEVQTGGPANDMQVTAYAVPAGYYNVTSTFTFAPAV